MLHNGLAVRRVVYREAIRIAKPVRVSAKDTHTSRMEGLRPDILRGLSQHFFKTGFQLLRRLVCKCNCNDSPRLTGLKCRKPSGLFDIRKVLVFGSFFKNFELCFGSVSRKFLAVCRLAVAQNVRYTVYEHGRLAAPRSREEQKRAFSRHDGLNLHIVQVRKITFNNGFPRRSISFFEL